MANKVNKNNYVQNMECKKSNKNNVQEMGPPRGGSGGCSPPEKKQNVDYEPIGSRATR